MLTFILIKDFCFASNLLKGNKILMKMEAVLKEYKEQVIAFLDDLITIFEDDGDLINARCIMGAIPIPLDLFVSNITNRITPHAEKIKNKDEDFFLSGDSADIFHGLGDNHVNKWKNMWTSDKLDSEHKETIFAWFDMFLDLSLQFKKLKE